MATSVIMAPLGAALGEGVRRYWPAHRGLAVALLAGCLVAVLGIWMRITPKGLRGLGPDASPAVQRSNLICACLETAILFAALSAAVG